VRGELRDEDPRRSGAMTTDEPEELNFTVELWTAGYATLYRTLARCARVDIARGAYKAALEAFP